MHHKIDIYAPVCHDGLMRKETNMHERMTITAQEVADALNVSLNSARGWLLRFKPIPNMRGLRQPALMRADEVIVRLRGTRQRGCAGFEAHRILQIDRAKRTADPGLPLGADPARRVHEMRECLTELELSRYHAVRGALHAGLVGCLWGDAWRADIQTLLDLALIHPSVLMYVLGDDHSELPTDTKQWAQWAQAYAAVNLAITRHTQKAA